MFGRKSQIDAQARLDAIGRSQAMIEFNLDGTIITANKNFLDALGYQLGEIQGKHHSMFVPADQRETAEYKAFWAALNRGEYQAREFKRIAKDGHEVWIEASYNPVLDGNGKTVMVAKIATDIIAENMQMLGGRGDTGGGMGGGMGGGDDMGYDACIGGNALVGAALGGLGPSAANTTGSRHCHRRPMIPGRG